MRSVFGYQTEPPICTRCGRVTDDNDPELRFRNGEVIECISCEPRPNPKPKRILKQGECTASEAFHFLSLSVDAFIANGVLYAEFSKPLAKIVEVSDA